MNQLHAAARRRRHPRTVRVHPTDRLYPTGAWMDLCCLDGHTEFAPLYVLLDVGVLEAYLTRSGRIHVRRSAHPASQALLADLLALLNDWDANGWPSGAEAKAALQRLMELSGALPATGAA